MVKKPLVAIIPARGGSKGLTGKNIKYLIDKPMISWTIEAALNSKYISDVFVSTESKEIAEISKKHGAIVPFMRPNNLAKDDSIASETYLYTINKLNNDFSKNIDAFVVLQPTSPLRTHIHIDEAIELFYNKNADSVISFYENPHPPNWLRNINENGYLKYLENQINLKNRQDYPMTYLPNGAIYILRLNLLEKYKTYYFDKTVPYLMSRRDSIDIDDEFDFEIAECILKKDI